MKRLFAILTAAALLVALLPASAFAAAKQMNDDVPVWTEETVRQYALDYIEGTSMSRLWGYYDLQIRRYMPMETFQALLTDLEWMTGEFIELGSYRSFEEPENQLKTHVLHLCMEKQDLDLYFTHKNKEDDWEIMAIEFVPAEDEPVSDGSDMLVGGRDAEASKTSYTETDITIGEAPYQLEGVLTMPSKASADAKVPACVLVHDFGPLDRNSTLGQTSFFSDLAKAFADMGIATLRYDKRTYVYGEDVVETVWDEVVEDALFAVQELQKNELVDQERVVLVGHGLGAMLAPRIVSQSDGAFTAMILIGGSPDSLLSRDLKRSEGLSEEVLAADQIIALSSMKEEDARELTLLGRNGYYYWEAESFDPISIMKKLKVPTYVVQGKRDPVVSEDDGWRAYADQLGDNQTYMTFKSFRGLNHLLMNDLSTNSQGIPEYAVEAHLDTQAGRNLSQWILNLYQTTDD